MTTLVDERRRGGNRLGPADYPVCGPSYERSREFPLDRERRDRNQRDRTRRAVLHALRDGELSPTLAAVMHALLDRCNGRLLERGPDGVGCSGWWSLGYIHSLLYAHDDDPEAGAENDDGPVNRAARRAGARTAGRWMRRLGELGWVARIHRHKISPGGGFKGTSNLWRIDIPDRLRDAMADMEDHARARQLEGRSRKRWGRTTPKKTGGPPNPAGAPAAPTVPRSRRVTCRTCEDTGWLDREVQGRPGYSEAYRCPDCGDP